MRNAIAFAVAPAALIFGLATAMVLAQDPPAFEVATIKLAASNAAPRNQLVRVSRNRISIPSMTLSWLIYTAYGEGMSTSTAVVGGPDWRNQIAYAIEAQAREPATQLQFQAMLRTLLEDRFRLRFTEKALKAISARWFSIAATASSDRRCNRGPVPARAAGRLPRTSMTIRSFRPASAAFWPTGLLWTAAPCLPLRTCYRCPCPGVSWAASYKTAPD